MTNKRIIAILSTIIVVVGVFAACRQHTKNNDLITVETTTTTLVEITSEKETATSERETTDTSSVTSESTVSQAGTTVKSTTKNSTKNPASTTKARTTTTKAPKTSTTQNNTTTKQQTTTAKPKTTKKVTTTKKQTTKKPQSRCTNNNNHSLHCGNMGRWFSSKADVKEYANSVMQDYFAQYESGKITWEEYVKICPYGYEAWSCSDCGKWTGNFKYH